MWFLTQESKSLLNQRISTRFESFFFDQRRYCNRKNSNCLITNQLKIQCLRKSKTFKKIYKMLRTKGKRAAGQLKSQKSP